MLYKVQHVYNIKVYKKINKNWSTRNILNLFLIRLYTAAV